MHTKTENFMLKSSAGQTLHGDHPKLTKIPIVIYYGDYVPAEPLKNPA